VAAVAHILDVEVETYFEETAAVQLEA
jgi:hypothetical protein